MINQSLSQSNDPLADSRFTFSTRTRFILLILLFNLLLMAVVLLSMRNQEIINRTLHVETINVQIQTRLAVVKRRITRIAYVTATFTPLPATATLPPSPTPTFTATPLPPTDTPVPSTDTPLPPTYTPTPTPTDTPVTPTGTPTPTPTPTEIATDTPTSTVTATPTATYTPPPPTPTSTATNTSPPPTPTSTATNTSTPTPTPTPTTALPPSVSGITPDNGDSESIVSATVNGANFQTGAAVVLRRTGYSDIVASSVTVSSASQITCQFDLTGAVSGPWDIVVINPDNQSGTLPGGFTVNPELDYFILSSINDQTAGIPFTVTITAYDRQDHIMTDFPGPANLSDTTATLSPTATGSFTAGVWTGNLTITLAQTGVAVTATSGGRSGVSNNFDIGPNTLDHFEFGTISSPQTHNQPFSILINAYDAYDNVATTYSSTAGLNDSTGTLSPTISGAFSAGSWSGNVTVSQVGAGDVITATSSIFPTVIEASNPFTVAYPAPSVTSIQPNTGVNTATTAVTITGSSFFATPSARLGVVPLQGVTFVNGTTLNATVPAGIAAGTYDLYVTNPGPLTPTGVLPNAFTVQNADIPSSTLETSYLVTFGTAITSPINGDNDSVQVIFLEVPDTVADTLYVRVFDPDLGTTNDDLHDSWDTATTFSLYGGNNAYTDPAARQATFTATTDPGISSGTQITPSYTFTQNATLDQTWATLWTVTPSQGEHVGNKYIFKLSVVGANSGDDGNRYNVALSTSNTTNILPSGGRVLAYSWTFRLPDAELLQVYPYVTSSATTFNQYNFDMDNSAAITITTPITVYIVTPAGISGEGSGPPATSGYTPTSDEQQVTWAAQYLATGPANIGTVWFTDQTGNALPIFTRSTTEPAP